MQTAIFYRGRLLLLLFACLSLARVNNPWYKAIKYKPVMHQGIEYIQLGQDMAHPNSVWGSLGITKQGLVYVLVCNHINDVGIYEYNTGNGKLFTLGTLKQHLKHHHWFQRQPKVHTPLFQYSKDGRVYFATDAGDRSQGAVYEHALEGYEGGYLVSLDPKTKTIHNLGLLKKWHSTKAMVLDDKHGMSGM